MQIFMQKGVELKPGSGETMRKPGSPGAPTAANFKRAAKTAKKKTQKAESLMAKPRKGKAKVKITISGQRGRLWSRGAKVRPNSPR